MNEEMKDLMEELQEIKHKVEKMEHKLQQKMGMRGGYGRMGRMDGYNRMGNGQNMGQAGGVFWGNNPMMQGGQYPMEDNWYDPRYM
jgi:hypothetical protein